MELEFINQISDNSCDNGDDDCDGDDNDNDCDEEVNDETMNSSDFEIIPDGDISDDDYDRNQRIKSEVTSGSGSGGKGGVVKNKTFTIDNILGLAESNHNKTNRRKFGFSEKIRNSYSRFCYNDEQKTLTPSTPSTPSTTTTTLSHNILELLERKTPPQTSTKTHSIDYHPAVTTITSMPFTGAHHQLQHLHHNNNNNNNNLHHHHQHSNHQNLLYTNWIGLHKNGTTSNGIGLGQAASLQHHHHASYLLGLQGIRVYITQNYYRIRYKGSVVLLF